MPEKIGNDQLKLCVQFSQRFRKYKTQKLSAQSII